MPRRSRIDAPGAIHHVIIRGIERSPIFRDAKDYEGFISRPALLLTETSILLLSLGLILFMFTLMARVSNPLTPRALFGILNVLTFFPSGALYPTESYPPWLNAISRIFPMRYAVHALRNLLLKGVGLASVAPDLLVMGAFAGVMLVLAGTLFKRTL